MSDGTQWIPTENLAASVLTGTRSSSIIKRTGKLFINPINYIEYFRHYGIWIRLCLVKIII